jgi:hypothetical protein
MKKFSSLVLALSSLLVFTAVAGCSSPSNISSAQTSSQEPQENVSAVRTTLENDGYEVEWASGSDLASIEDAEGASFYAEIQCVKEGLSANKSNGFFFVFFCNNIADAETFLAANIRALYTDRDDIGFGRKNNAVWVGILETAKKVGWADSQIRTSLASSSEEPERETAEVMAVLENNGYEVEWTSPSRVESLPCAETRCVKEALSAHKSNGVFLVFFCNSISDAETFMKANLETFISHLESEDSGLGSRNNIVWCGSREAARLLNWAS